jgi:hypothetical protein
MVQRGVQCWTLKTAASGEHHEGLGLSKKQVKDKQKGIYAMMGVPKFQEKGLQL